MPHTIPQLNILHIVDSLSAGGTERVAVNLCNAISEYPNVKVSLCATRKLGPLAAFLSSTVPLHFVQKKSVADIKAFLLIRRLVTRNGITIIHAHSSSVFCAILATLGLSTKVIWHIHDGNIMKNKGLKRLLYKLIAPRISFIFVVNHSIESWACQVLNITSQKVVYLPNYPSINSIPDYLILPKEGQLKMVCLANFRIQKNHFALLEAFKKSNINAVLYLVGVVVNEDYYQQVIQSINKLELTDSVIILLNRKDVYDILSQCDVGVLSSSWEGLPLALLEYGYVGLPVICTDVGECAEVLGKGKYGLMVEPDDVNSLTRAICQMASSESLRALYKDSFHKFILTHYTKESAMAKCMNTYLLASNVEE